MAHAFWHGKIIKRWKSETGKHFYILTEKGWLFETGPRQGNARTLFRPNTSEARKKLILETIERFEEVPYAE